MLKRLLSFVADNDLWLVLAVSPLLLVPSRYSLAGLALLPLPWLCRLLTRGGLTVRTRMDIAIVGLLVMTAVSLYPSVSLYLSWPKLLGIVLGVSLFYSIVNHAKSERSIKAGGACLCAGAFLVALVGLVGTDWSIPKFFSLPQVEELLPRLAPIIPRSALPAAREGLNPNEVGGALAMLLPLPLALILFEKGIMKKALLAPVVLLVAVTLVLTQSRSAFMGLGAALIALAVLRHRKLVLPLSMLLAGLVVFAFAGGLDNLKGVLLSSDGSGGLASSLHAEERIQLWWIALQMVRDFPLTGIGLNTFPLVMANMYPFFVSLSKAPHAHNLFLQTAVDLGIPGLLAFFGLLAAFAMTLRRATLPGGPRAASPIALGIGSGVLAYLVFGLTDAFTLGAKPGIFFWAMLGLAAAQCALAGHEVKPDRPESTAGRTRLEEKQAWAPS